MAIPRALEPSGLVLVDKPVGPSSFQVVRRLRTRTGARAGHAGTLDPFASGLLLVLLGASTRLARYLVGLDKRYLTEIEVALVEAETPDATLEQAAPGRPAPAFAVLGAETGAGGGPAESAGDQVRTPAAEPAVDLTGPRPPAIVPLVQRDVATMSRLVECLAGSDPEQRRRWQLCLATFVDAVVTAAIDHGCFTFPGGNPFWDQFTPDQARNVAQNLAALGFRHDGTGEFVDGRVPGQRDLSMAVGQAGLPIVRVRFWPRPQEAARLFRHVRVDTTAVLSERAPSLTKGELVRLLDRRAELVADLCNDWSRVRPLLLLQSRD